MNLTAIRDPEQILPRHFGESLFLARHLFPLATNHRPLTTVLDIGSGAGFPALPVKIWEPSIHLTMIEANHKKAAFLREVTRALTLTNVDVIAARAESLQKTGSIKHPPDVVTFRAVEKFDQILPVAAGFLGPRSMLALLLTGSQLPNQHADSMLTWQTLNIPKSHDRILAIGSMKVA